MQPPLRTSCLSQQQRPGRAPAPGCALGPELIRTVQGAAQGCRVQCRGAECGAGCSAGMQAVVQGCRVQCRVQHRDAGCSAGMQGAAQASCLGDLFPAQTGSSGGQDTGSGALARVTNEGYEVFSCPLLSVLARQGLPPHSCFAANGTFEDRRKERSPQVTLFPLITSQICAQEPSLAAQSRALLPGHHHCRGVRSPERLCVVRSIPALEKSARERRRFGGNPVPLISSIPNEATMTVAWQLACYSLFKEIN